MAYLTIMKQCLADECTTCPGHENTPPHGHDDVERRDDCPWDGREETIRSCTCPQRVGGGICVHNCHSAVSPALEESVRKAVQGD